MIYTLRGATIWLALWTTFTATMLALRWPIKSSLRWNCVALRPTEVADEAAVRAVGNRGDIVREISRVRKAVVFVACATAIVIVVAGRQQRTAPPLQPNAEVAARLEKEKADQAFYESAGNMTAAEVDALEESLKRTPEDFDALKKLRYFYQVSGQEVFGWNEMIARRRPHILWLIDNHPEHELAMWPVSAEADPVGYTEAKARWLAKTAEPDVKEKVLINAAHFLSRADAPLAEQMLLRARAMTTAPERLRALSSRLGNFYADVIKGPRDPRNGFPLTRIDSDPYAREVRQRLAESNDAALLAAAGGVLARVFRDEDRRRLGKQLLERAGQIDPQQRRARTLLTALDNDDRISPLGDKVRRRAAVLAGGQIAAKLIAQEPLTQEDEKLRDAQPQAISELSEADRFALLPGLADSAYMQAESLDWSKEREAAEALFARSKKYAHDTLALAPKFRGDPDYGNAVYHATIALGAHALREGDKTTAVRYMLDAIRAPASGALETPLFGLDRRLVNYLLKEGERATVVEFLERSADLRPAEREHLLEDASAIRAGKMPMSFQYMVSRK